MPPRDLNDAKHWRDRAAEMRALAEGYADQEAARIMLRLADDYDKLADRAAERTRTGAHSGPSPTGNADQPTPRRTGS